MHPVLILAAIPLLLRTAAFAQCQRGWEGKLNQQKTEDLRGQIVQPAMIHVVAVVKSNTVAYFPNFLCLRQTGS